MNLDKNKFNKTKVRKDLFRFAGTIKSNIPNMAVKHNKYLGKKDWK